MDAFKVIPGPNVDAVDDPLKAIYLLSLARCLRPWD
jgi:hypothetical protein